ncbi:hypothetical protein CEXT_634241 [Caerostris extrusa]|uniref:Secreted protein n=1 Tax=Caerostris extrusa TaxID=172846 RepID=A0AAV4RHY8_CAEEX|nr:hypothetical protein CEXT_634241 [Caerostris extrusa]
MTAAQNLPVAVLHMLALSYFWAGFSERRPIQTAALFTDSDKCLVCVCAPRPEEQRIALSESTGSNFFPLLTPRRTASTRLKRALCEISRFQNSLARGLTSGGITPSPSSSNTPEDILAHIFIGPL